MVADGEHAATGTCYYDAWLEKNRNEGLETSHTILPQNLVQIDAGSNTGSD